MECLCTEVHIAEERFLHRVRSELFDLANNNGKLPDSYQAQYTPSNGVYNGSIYDYWVYSWDKVWGGYSALLYSMDPQKYSAHGSELVFDMDQLVGNKNQAYYPVGGGWGAYRYY